eukprot:jgi/Hompol1/1088/HPOL_002641-RA
MTKEDPSATRVVSISGFTTDRVLSRRLKLPFAGADGPSRRRQFRKQSSLRQPTRPQPQLRPSIQCLLLVLLLVLLLLLYLRLHPALQNAVLLLRLVHLRLGRCHEIIPTIIISNIIIISSSSSNSSSAKHSRD